MKNIGVLIVFLFGTAISSAQTGVNDIGKIALSVVMPSNIDNIESREFAKLESKIQQIASKNGIAGSGYNTNFVIIPKFEIFEEGDINTGVAVKKYIKGELSLYVSQTDNNLIFYSTSISIKGVADNRDKSILNAISGIDVNNKELNGFFVTAKSKIIQYYTANCDQISQKADALVKKQQYEEAIGLLMSIPDEVTSCKNKIQAKSVEAYLAYQNNICSKSILQAKAVIANNDLSSALSILMDIDPQSICFKDAEKLISDIQKEFKRKEERVYNDNQEQIKRDLEERKLQLESDRSIETARINAIKELAVSYYQNQNKQQQVSGGNTYIVK